MPRMTFVFLLGLLLSRSVRAEHPAIDDTPQLTFDVDVIRFECDFLKKIGCDERPSNGFLMLDESEAFFLVEAIANNNKDKNVYARPKVSFPDGKPIKISNRALDDAARRMIVRNGAWLHVLPFEFELTPKIAQDDKVRLTLTYSLNRRKRTRGPSTVASGKTVLVLLDCPEKCVPLAAMITPRIISK